MAKEPIIRETREIVPRYYGLSFRGEGNLKVFDSPTTAALAVVAITSPDKENGLVDMLKDWQIHKPRELRGEFGYEPLFKLSQKQIKKLLECSVDQLVKIVRESIKRNHGSYNLFDCYGKEAVCNLTLRGELLTADVRSQEEGWHGINLKGAVRGVNGEMRYVDSFCGCGDNRWAQTKGGKEINVRRNCLHIKAAELDSYLQDTRVQHPLREMMKGKNVHSGERSLTFNFVDEYYLKYLLMDVLIAHEVLRQSSYCIDRTLLKPIIASAIIPLSLRQGVARGNATFEIIRQKMRKGEIDPDLYHAQKIIDEAFDSTLRKAGYKWQGHCLELGCEAFRYENPETQNALSLVFNASLPFYVVRFFGDKNSRVVDIFTPDYGPQNPYTQLIGIKQRRIDDRTRRETLCYIEPAIRINIPELKKPVSLRYDLPTRVLDAFRRGIKANNPAPSRAMKSLRIYY